MRHGAWGATVLVGLFALGSVGLPAAELRFSSTWRDRDVRVDGVDEEWRDIVVPVKGEHFSVGFLNDGEALYFCLLSRDSTTIRQVSLRGLVVWLDANRDKKRTFGILFPVTEGAQGPRRSTPPPGPPATPQGEDPPPEGEIAPGQRAIRILGARDRDARDVENGASGIVARYTAREDLLVYELRVPLRKGETWPFAPGVEPGGTLRLELQTPDWRGPMPMRPGWPRVGIGVGRPGGGVFYPGADASLLRPLKVTAELSLARQP